LYKGKGMKTSGKKGTFYNPGEEAAHYIRQDPDLRGGNFPQRRRRFTSGKFLLTKLMSARRRRRGPVIARKNCFGGRSVVNRPVRLITGKRGSGGGGERGEGSFWKGRGKFNRYHRRYFLTKKTEEEATSGSWGRDFAIMKPSMESQPGKTRGVKRTS